jgi:ferric-dicitrate binding protein FerR (iron transport regulator)
MFYRVFVTVLMVQSLAWGQSGRFVSVYYSEGNVLMSLGGTGPFWSTAANVAVTPGSIMKTSSDSWAEVRLEDGSIIRVAPDSELVFEEVGISPAGERVTAMSLNSGEAEFRIKRHSGNLFQLKAATKTIKPASSSKFRVSANSMLPLKVVVRKGKVEVYGSGAAPEFLLKAKQTLAQSPNLSTFAVGPGDPRDALERWSRKRDDHLVDRYWTASDLRPYCQRDPDQCNEYKDLQPKSEPHTRSAAPPDHSYKPPL